MGLCFTHAQGSYQTLTHAKLQTPNRTTELMGHSFVLGCMLRPHVHTCTIIEKYRRMVLEDG